VIALAKPNWLTAIGQIFSTQSIQVVAEYIRGFGLWAPTISIILMTLQAVIAPLPSPLIAGANGILFGIWWGTFISWIGGLAGAAVSFWLARSLGQSFAGHWIKPQYLRQIDRFGQWHGFWIVLAARLTPVISLDFIGYLAGLSRMRFGQYMLANAIGLTPGMLAYTILGHDLALAQISTWRVSLILLCGLVLFLTGRWWLSRQSQDFGQNK
jgi:uncharacterized membrane protein YdjX (TVP38/TMEM64 family)